MTGLLRYFAFSPGLLNRDDGTCAACGRCLYGVTHARCPECGPGFTPWEVGMTFDDLHASAPRECTETANAVVALPKAGESDTPRDRPLLTLP